MNYSINYNLNKPERNEQFNLDHWNENTDAIDTAMNTNKTNIANNASNISTILTGLSTINTSDTNSVYYKLMKLIYPVGSIYWSSRSTNPSTLFGGNWVQIKDRFVLACGDTYNTTGTTGGASSVTLSVSNMPSHDHTFTPSGDVSSHSHGLNSHTHSFSHTHDYSGDGRTDEMSKNSKGNIWTDDRANGIFNGNEMKSDGNIKLFGAGRWAGGNVEYSNQPNTLHIDISHTHKFSWSGTTTSQSTSTTDSASGDTASATPSFTGTQGTTDSNGSGTAFNILPPYVVKYCWERIA